MIFIHSKIHCAHSLILACGLACGAFSSIELKAQNQSMARNEQSAFAGWTSTTYQDKPLSGIALGYGYHFGLGSGFRVGLVGNLCLFQPRTPDRYLPYTYAIHYGVGGDYLFRSKTHFAHRIGLGLGASLNSIRLERQKTDGVYSHVSMRYGFEWKLRPGLSLGPSATYYFYPTRPKTNGDLLLGLSLGFDRL